jgi:uncharacterized protein Usg
MRFSSDLERQLNGYGLTTAHILYRIPDFESVLLTYVWQEYDLGPIFPKCTGSSISGSPTSTGRCILCAIRISA